MENHFVTLEKLVDDNDIPIGLIFNLDEMDATLDKYFDGFSQPHRVLSRQNTINLKLVK